MRPTFKVDSIESLSLAVMRFRQNGAAVLPVVTDDRLIGVITEASLARALGEGADSSAEIGVWVEPAETIRPFETCAEALRRCESGATLVAVDENERVIGVISAADLWPRRHAPLRPPVVGGMATPFGVYLTTGSISSGVSKWALVATGAAMFGMLAIAAELTQLLWSWAPAKGPAAEIAGIASDITALILFFGLMRLVPLSGTHGAEHQVVNAIERDEELKPEIVRRMPRVHPRCGTNLMVGAFTFTAIAESWTSLGPIRYVLAAVVTFATWRWLGGLMQQFVTTKRPNDRQLAGGITAGKELLQQYAVGVTGYTNPWVRIWNSGLLHVIGGASLAATLLWAILKVLNLPTGLVS